MSEFYVYRLIDPRDSACFYIGKGKGDRAWEHQKQATYSHVDNPHKRARILAIVTAKLDVEIEIVARFDDEQMAYAHEYDLIQTTPNLTNIAPGRRPPPTPEQIAVARRLAEIARRIAKQKQLREAREAQYKRFVRGLPDHLQAAAAEWVASLKEAPLPENKPKPLPTHVACEVRPAPAIFGPPEPKPKRRNTRKLRRKYRPSVKIPDGPPLKALPNLRA